MGKNVYSFNPFVYEDLSRKIFSQLGFVLCDDNKLHSPNMCVKTPFDFCAKYGNTLYCVEVKASTQLNYPVLSHLFDAIYLLSDYSKSIGAIPVLVVFSVVSEEDKEKYNDKLNGVIILDLPAILYLVQGSDIQNEIISQLPFSTDQVQICENKQFDIKREKRKINKKKSVEDDLIHKLKKCKVGTEGDSDFESVCTEILKYLFSDTLSLWLIQPESNARLYKFDLLCRIKDNTQKTFWTMLEDFFNSKYVVFEYKNYSKEIKQTQIYTTEKYLYNKALRNTAIIIARNGYEENAEWAAKGSLRENGKLIMLVDEDDLIKMIDLRKNNEDPSMVFLDKMDNLLLKLEK